MKTLLSNAIAFAAEKHNGQYDKGGMPYILHPLKVMHYIRTDDLELMAIAVLHDVVEDCYDNPEEGFSALFDMGMSPRVIAGVRAMTKINGQSSDVYTAGLLTNKDAIIVKMADLRHNMDVRRLKGVSEKDAARLDKYAKMYTILKEHLVGQTPR